MELKEDPTGALVSMAKEFAKKAHETQVRKYTNEPYFVHCEEVAKTVAAVDNSTQEMIAAAYLHDTVEDTQVTLEQIRTLFGETVASLVEMVTDVSKKTDGNRAIRKKIDMEHIAKASPEGKTIKLADLISNSRSIVDGDPGFAKVYLAEKTELLKVLKEGDSELLALAHTVLAEGIKDLKDKFINFDQRKKPVF